MCGLPYGSFSQARKPGLGAVDNHRVHYIQVYDVRDGDKCMACSQYYVRVYVQRVM